MRVWAPGLWVLLMLSALPLASQETIANPYCRGVGENVQHGAELERACDWVQSLSIKLPNVICRETIKRYVSVLWSAPLQLDTVTAIVRHDNRGGQTYSDIKVDGKPVAVRISDLLGPWTEGDFAGELSVLFGQQSRTHFKFSKETSVESKPALLFDFHLAQKENRSWSLTSAKGTVFPELDGKLWLEKSSNNVLRLEIETSKMPADFPIQRVTKKIDYANVQLGDGSNFVLPTDLEARFEENHLRRQSRNLTTFRDCHKFAAKARVVGETE